MYDLLQDAEKQIRLLRLLPGRESNPICIEIGVFDRNKAPDYIAISYAWGDDSDEQTVMVDGVEQQVWKNCFYALWQARLHYSNAWIWIDSLCINQSDLNEKSHQVRVMGQI